MFITERCLNDNTHFMFKFQWIFLLTSLQASDPKKLKVILETEQLFAIL